MAFTKRKVFFTRPQKKASKVITLHLPPHMLRSFSKQAEAMADPTQGAFTGLRSRKSATPAPTAALGTPTAFEDPASSDACPRLIGPSILKPSSRKATGKTKKRVTIREDARGLSESPTTQPASGFDSDDDDNDNDMSGEGSRPKLTLSFSKINVKPPADRQTPLPQSATRTPSLKLKLNPKPPPPFSASSTPSADPKPKSARPTNALSKIAGKKRKQPVKNDEDSSEDELTRRPSAIRRITLTNKSAPTPTPTLKIKHKGKIPKRPLGVGYDSELSDREADPTLLEAFVLRMPPGDDCTYLRNVVNNGTFGMPRAQGGADVQIRPLDRHGRRAVVTIQGRKWAAAMVDLPCIIEGMKSWDKKSWIKSADICQMLLVLEPIRSDEEAHTVQLPKDVNPKTNQYAHGITPPMRWVRKRRFARTNRTQVSDIEAVERKVNQLLQEDAAALHVKHELVDPEQLETRDQDMEEYSDEEYDEEEDAEGEDVEDGTPDNYFAAQNGETGEMVDTPTYVETPVEDVGDEEIDEFEAALLAEDDEEAPHVAVTDMAAMANQNGLHPPEGDSSFAVTSTSASPSATVAHTPATATGDSSDEDEEDDDADGSGSDNSPDSADDADKQDADNLQEVRDKIQEIEEKIQEQTRAMNEQPNHIIRKKFLVKINALKGDVEQMRNTAGLREDDE